MKNPQQAFAEALEIERKFVDSWRQPSEVTLFETVRAIDSLFMADLFSSAAPSRDETDQQYRTLSSWGTNQALSRVMPTALTHGPFRHFKSVPKIQNQADDLLFHGGVLETAEMLHEWLFEGLLQARLDAVQPMPNSKIEKILVLKTGDRTLFGELISIMQRKWRSAAIMQDDRQTEIALEQEHLEIIPELDKNLRPLPTRREP